MSVHGVRRFLQLSAVIRPLTRLRPSVTDNERNQKMRKSIIAAMFAGVLASGMILAAPAADAIPPIPPLSAAGQVATVYDVVPECNTPISDLLPAGSSSNTLPPEYRGSAKADGTCSFYSYGCIPPCNMVNPTTGLVPTGASPCSDTGTLNTN